MLDGDVSLKSIGSASKSHHPFTWSGRKQVELQVEE